jgi:hypothetical protein
VNSIQPYLPWILVGAIGLLAWVRFRRWSVEYSAAVVTELETKIEAPTSPVSSSNGANLSPLEIHRQIIRDHVAALPGNPADKIEPLIHDLALVKLLRQLEGIYYSIFHSQVVFLRNLNLVAGMAERANAEQFFNNLCTENPELTKISFESWLKYISDEGLIIVVDSKIGISPLGQEFLVWLIRQKKPDKQNGL